MSNVCLIIYTIDLPIYYKDKILNLRIIIVSIHIDNVVSIKIYNILEYHSGSRTFNIDLLLWEYDWL